MPLLLCRGAQSTMKAVHQTLCHMFDCIITTVKATEDDLKWIVPIVLTAEESQTRETMKGDLKLEYTVPDLPVTETITVKFSVSDVSEMWKTYVITQFLQSKLIGILLLKMVFLFSGSLKTRSRRMMLLPMN